LQLTPQRIKANAADEDKVSVEIATSVSSVGNVYAAPHPFFLRINLFADFAIALLRKMEIAESQ